MHDMNVCQETADKRVSLGAEMLDRTTPGWYRIIDGIDMEDCYHCILGQVYKGSHQQSPYAMGCLNLGVIISPHVYGFNISREHEEGEPSYAQLAQAWENAIDDRIQKREKEIRKWQCTT